MCSSQLFQCFRLEVFWVFVQKYGDVFVTRNMLQEPNSGLCKPMVKLVLLYIILLKVAVSKNLSTTLGFTLSEDFFHPFLHQGFLKSAMCQAVRIKINKIPSLQTLCSGGAMVILTFQNHNLWSVCLGWRQRTPLGSCCHGQADHDGS